MKTAVKKVNEVAVFMLLACVLAPLVAGEEGRGLYIPGEELVYRVYALRVPAGRVSFSVDSLKGEAGKEFYILRAVAESTFPFSAFFRVRNTFESRVGADTRLPEFFEKDRREAAFRRNIKVNFDREKNLALIEGESSSFEIPPGVQDYFSSLYYLRGLEFSVGDNFSFTATGGRKIYDVEIEVPRRESISISGKDRDTIVVRPIVRDLEPGGVIGEAKGQEIELWLTDDERKIPVRIELKLGFGTASMVLVSHTEGG